MKRVMIIGSRGAGKSTLAEKLAAKTGLPIVHLDMLYWNDDGKGLPLTEFEKILLAEIEKELWIIDGNYIGAMEPMLKNCDTVIFLDYSRVQCLCGVIQRALLGKENYSREGYSGKLDFAFLKFIWRTAEKNRAKYHAVLRNVTDKQVVVLKNRSACKTFLKSIRQ